MRLFLFYLCFISVTLATFHNGTAKAEVLNVCSEAGFVPFEQIDAKGAWSGFDIDLLDQFSKTQNVIIRMLNISLDGIIPALLTKKCDLIASALTVTPQRAKMIQFSDDVMEVKTIAVALTSNQAAQKIKDFELLEGSPLVLGCQLGSSSCLYLQSHFKNVKISQFKSESDEINALLEKKIDFLVEDEIFLIQAQKKLKLSLHVVPSSNIGKIAFGFRKGDHKLEGQLHNFIAKIKQDGSWSKIKLKYF